jgi:hypothetical protein
VQIILFGWSAILQMGIRADQYRESARGYKVCGLVRMRAVRIQTDVIIHGVVRKDQLA